MLRFFYVCQWETPFETRTAPSERLMRYSVLLLAGLALFGCSTFKRSSSTPEMKIAVLRVSDDYLRSIATGNVHQVEGLIEWTDYILQKKGRITKAEVRSQVEGLVKRWTPQDHPLLGLNAEEVDVDDDHATIVLRKANQPEAPEIHIDLVWAGGGWLVYDDSIFGPDGLFEKVSEQTN